MNPASATRLLNTLPGFPALCVICGTLVATDSLGGLDLRNPRHFDDHSFIYPDLLALKILIFVISAWILQPPGLKTSASPLVGMGESKYAATYDHSQASNGVDVTALLNNLSLQQQESCPFENVPETEAIILLTPYLQAPPPHISASAQSMDPFEPFGRSLTEYHSNIRHVPYVATYDMTDTHRHLLNNAGGVIVVVCEPPALAGVSSKQRVDGLKAQRRFAKAVGKYIGDMPSVLVTVELQDVKEGEKYYATIVELADWEELEDAANDIFGG